MSEEQATQPKDHDDHRSPAEGDALKDVDIKSGTGDPDLEYPEQQGEAHGAFGTTSGDENQITHGGEEHQPQSDSDPDT